MCGIGVELLQSGRELTTKVENNLGLSSCAVPQSAVICVVAYFRRTELLPGVQEGSGCQGRGGAGRSRLEWSGITPEWVI